MGSECWKVLGEVKERCRGVGKCERVWGGECGKVWRDVSGECGGAGERCWVSVEGVGRDVEKCVGFSTSPHLSASQYTFPHFNSTSTDTPYTLPHLYHTCPHPRHLPYTPTQLPIPTTHFPTPFFYVSLILDPTLLKLPKIPRD